MEQACSVSEYAELQTQKKVINALTILESGKARLPTSIPKPEPASSDVRQLLAARHIQDQLFEGGVFQGRSYVPKVEIVMSRKKRDERRVAVGRAMCYITHDSSDLYVAAIRLDTDIDKPKARKICAELVHAVNRFPGSIDLVAN